MINVETGEIKLDDHGIIFHVDLTLEQFRNSHTPPLTLHGNKEHKYSEGYSFKANIDGMDAKFQIYFRYTKLAELRFSENIKLYDRQEVLQELLNASKISHAHYLAVLQKQTDFTSKIEAQQQDRLNRWLAQATLASPPYEYAWGEIVSLIDYRSGGDPEIIVRFKKDFP
jgi:hypothetical protein